MPRIRPPYPPEFRREAVAFVRSGTPLKQVAAEQGVSEADAAQLAPPRRRRRWSRRGLTTDEREELRGCGGRTAG